jgi:CBS domain-containing protein
MGVVLKMPMFITQQEQAPGVSHTVWWGQQSRAVCSNYWHVLCAVQDIIRVRRAEGSLRAPVADHMTSPALTVGPKVSVRQAAKIMLQHKIRRLPVVDKNGQAMG